MKISSRVLRAFTLIELLIVIAIIGILMALLFPAVNGAITAARKTQARNDATQIATACTAYETEYGVGPWSTNKETQVDGDLLQKLMGTNTRGLVFLEVQDTKGNHKNGFTNGAFIDPWGGVYQIAYDTTYSSSIQNAGSNKDQLVRKQYAVWTDPSKQQWNTNTKPDRRYVESW